MTSNHTSNNIMAAITSTTEQEKIAIANATIVFVVAVSGCGKSFTGDYLHSMHGYTHVDGDGPIKNSHIPRNKELSFDLFTNGFTYVMKGEDGPEELWQPYYDEIAKNTIEAAKHSDKIVLSQAAYRQSHREFVLDKLVEFGATRENITVLELMIDPDVKLKGLYCREKGQCEMGGITQGDSMRAQGWEGAGEITCAEYIKFMKEKRPEFFGNNAYVEIPIGFGKKVDVSGRDITHLDSVDEALGLVGKRKDKNLSFEDIRDKVKVVDQKRDKDMIVSGAGEEISKFIKEIMGGSIDDEDKTDDIIVATDTEEQEKDIQRRSSLISV